MRERSEAWREPSFWATAAVFVGRSLRHSARNVEALVMAVMLPVMLMLMFTCVFGGALDPDGNYRNYINYVVPGIILLCAGFGSSGTAVDVAIDMTGGIMDRFRAMPIRSKLVIAGHVTASLARNFTATAIVIVLALAMGFRPNAGLPEWIGAALILMLFTLAITWLYAAIGIVAGTPSAASGYGFVLLFLPYLSSAFVRTDTMPDWLQWIAENQPVTPVVESLRGLLLGAPAGDHVWKAVVWCLLILLGAYLWASYAFRRKGSR